MGILIAAGCLFLLIICFVIGLLLDSFFGKPIEGISPEVLPEKRLEDVTPKKKKPSPSERPFNEIEDLETETGALTAPKH